MRWSHKHFTYIVRAYTGVCWQHSCYYGPDGITILDWCFKLLETGAFQSSLFGDFCVFLFGGCWEAGRWYLGCFFFPQFLPTKTYFFVHFRFKWLPRGLLLTFILIVEYKRVNYFSLSLNKLNVISY